MEAGVARRRWLAALRALRFGVGLTATLCSAFWVGMTMNGMPSVLAVDSRVYESSQDARAGLTMLLVAVAGLLVTTGAAMVGRIDVGQILTAAWMLFWVFAFLNVSEGFQFSGPDAVCIREGCWPLGVQAVVAGAPLLVALLTAVVLGFLGSWVGVIARAAIPAGLLVLLTLIQTMVWRTMVLPWLLAGPG